MLPDLETTGSKLTLGDYGGPIARPEAVVSLCSNIFEFACNLASESWFRNLNLLVLFGLFEFYTLAYVLLARTLSRIPYVGLGVTL